LVPVIVLSLLSPLKIATSVSRSVASAAAGAKKGLQSLGNWARSSRAFPMVFPDPAPVAPPKFWNGTWPRATRFQLRPSPAKVTRP
jgi:hypothetical protein